MAVKEDESTSECLELDTLALADTRTPSSSPRKRRVAAKNGEGSPRKKAVSSNKVPTCLEEASPEDRLIITMKEQGHSWGEIRAAWEKLTGVKVSNQYCSVRHHRIKANFTVIDERDVPKLIEARQIVEKEMCTYIAKTLVSLGGGDYAAAVIQKKLKELDKQGGTQ
ncbi:hypothetical protein AAP_06003 [Ascosphaera apis ARSEF 7405]|uniref:Myb-like domain-containing protein n=1 Tax=Ascosphaera apis ARSEF 7405 TaxID=392613 RepID=A0A167V526_9EURO|nr:hypothetical protein AAP_06003 [Ascosphaera apis ARSEF 7405]